MQSVSTAWKTAQRQNFVPEAYIEISYKVTDPDADTDASATATLQDSISNVSQIVDGLDHTFNKYVTLEHNLWGLDGTYPLYTSAMTDIGYLSSNTSGSDCSFTTHPVITISFTQVHSNPIPGITIDWSSAFGEWATDYIITAYANGTQTAQKTVTGNTSITAAYAAFTISSFDTITIEVTKWCLPGRRCRIENVILGAIKTFAKADIISFDFEQSVDLLSLELPKSAITFEINNVDGSFNPDNPTGIYQYLLERQQVTAKMGYKLNGAIEWIKCGTFWLSEWTTPQNGITATFTASSLTEFMNNKFSPTAGTYTLTQLATSAFTQSNVPTSSTGAAMYQLDSSLGNISVTITVDDYKDYTCAEIVQLCANAAQCVMYFDRSGIAHVAPLVTTLTDYTIDRFVSYQEAEYDITKELQSVNVNSGLGTYSNSSTGEIQTIDNALIQTSTVANNVASWVGGILSQRKKISGELRIDCRVDALDKVTVTNKYATMYAYLTGVKCSFNGAFKGSYDGRVVSS